jgi:hypothetical protein
MKRITTILLLLPFIGLSQDNCTENFATVSASYVVPKSFGLGVDYFTKIGLTVGIGGIYTKPETYAHKQGENSYDSVGNSLDIFAFVGYRVLQIDYKVSIFANAGYVMGDQHPLQPFLSTKVLFPINTKAISFEPVYIFERRIAWKLSIHFKL